MFVDLEAMIEGPYIESIWRCGNGEFAAESTAFAAIGIAWPDGDYVAPSVGFGANQCGIADGCRFVHSAVLERWAESSRHVRYETERSDGDSRGVSAG